MAKILEIASSIDGCTDGSGSGNGSGKQIIESYLSKCSNLDFESVWVNDLQIVDIPWQTVDSPWVKITPSEDGTAYFDQKWDENNGVVSQESYFKITGITDSNINAFRIIKEQCCVVLIHVLEDGTSYLQGGEIFIKGPLSFDLIPTIDKATNTNTTITTPTQDAGSKMDVWFRSVSECFSPSIIDYKLLVGIDTDEPVTGSMSIDATVFVSIDDVLLIEPQITNTDCGHSTVKSAIYLNNDIDNYINIQQYPFSIKNAFCGKLANGATSIKVSSSLTTACGTVVDLIDVPITVKAGIISHINGVSCGIDFSPTVDVQISANIITGVVYDTKGLPWASRQIILYVNGFPITSFSFTSTPINLSDYLCGLGPFVSPPSVLVKGLVWVFGETQAEDNIPITVTIGSNGKINSVEGVACPAPEFTPPTVELSLTGTILGIVWDTGNDDDSTRSLIIDNGTNLITLDSSLSSIDLGDILYGIESAGSTSQVYIISAEINNSVGSDADSLNCTVLTETWSGGRFIYAVNSVEAPAPTIDSISYSGNSIIIGKTDGIWKFYQVEIRYHRNPMGWTEGVFAVSEGNAVKDGIFIFTIGSLTSKYCGNQHVVGSPFIAVRVNTPLTGYHTRFDGPDIPFTVDGSNLITSINGVSC